MDSKQFFNLLFNEGEHSSLGTGFSVDTQLINAADKNCHFFCINPLHGSKNLYKNGLKNEGRRADINVVQFRNFMFEMDSIPLTQQYMILVDCGIPWTSIVYSGGKSYHAILSLEPGLPFETHEIESIEQYKLIWKRIALFIDEAAIDSGLNLASNKKSLIDPTSCNPSRLSRVPGIMREGKKQELMHLGQRMELNDFYEFLDKCPAISRPVTEQKNTKLSTNELDEFVRRCPQSLYMLIFNSGFWAASEGMYPKLFRLSLWAIEETGCTQDLLLSFMEVHTFPALIKAGYPKYKLTKPIEHAYILKGE